MDGRECILSVEYHCRNRSLSLFPVAAKSGRGSGVEGRVAATANSKVATSDSDEDEGLSAGEFE